MKKEWIDKVFDVTEKKNEEVIDVSKLTINEIIEKVKKCQITEYEGINLRGYQGSSLFFDKLINLNISDDTKKNILKALCTTYTTTERGEGQKMEKWAITLFNLPWDRSANVDIDAKKIRTELDKSHYGMKETKEALVEYFVNRKYSTSKSKILCLSGPAGVGKTSIARSIAKALKLPFQKISLAGDFDGSAFIGLDYSWSGSRAGNLMTAFIQSGVNNPIILLDEIDKISMNKRGSTGDFADALIEVLDPDENKCFKDKYINVPFDISNALFICTANDLYKINPILLDRLEIVYVPQYSNEEKVLIAKNYIIPEVKKQNKVINVNFKDDAIEAIVKDYSYGFGVRRVRQMINRTYSKCLLEHDENHRKQFTIHKKDIEKWFKDEKIIINYDVQYENTIGVANIASVAGSVGMISKVEVSSFPGNGRIIMTGNLDESVKESIEVAIGYLRSKKNEFQIETDYFETHDIQVHFLEGGVLKKGTSAGAAICMALLSEVKGWPVNMDVVITGEISLHGKIMPIGGVQEKMIGAIEQSCNTMILPIHNQQEYDRISDNIKNKIKTIFGSDIEDVVQYFFKESYVSEIKDKRKNR